MKYLLIFILFSPFALAQNQFKMENNYKFVAYILKSTNDSLTIQREDGMKITLQKNKIVKSEQLYSELQLTNGRTLIGHIYRKSDDSIYVKTLVATNESHPISDLVMLPRKFKDLDYYIEGKQTYFLFGGTVLLPGAINLVGGYHFSDRFGARVHAGLLILSAQVDIMYNLSKKEYFEHNLSLIGGVSNLDAGIAYLGTAYDLNIYGFQLQLGVAYTNFDTPVQIIGSIGYVHRFN